MQIAGTAFFHRPGFELCNWDCWWYVSIVREYYHAPRPPWPSLVGLSQTNWPFFPVFPLSALAISKLFGLSAPTALVVTSTLSYFLAVLVFFAYLSRRLGEETAFFGAAVLVFSPYAIYGYAGYSEPLYFLLSTIAYWAAIDRRWLAAGLTGAVLSAVRPVGVLFGLPLLLAGLCQWRELRASNTLVRFLCALALAPLGLLAFMAYMYVLTGDPLAFIHIQSAWGRHLHNPISLIWQGLGEFYSSPIGFYSAMAAVSGIAMACYLMARRYFIESLWLLLNVIVPLFAGLQSMPRFVAWQMPFVFGITLLGQQFPALKYVILAVTGLFSGFMAVAWLSGQFFVV